MNVWSVCVGTRYGPEYVHRLRNMVARHLSVPHEFHCITDSETVFDMPGITCHQAPKEINGVPLNGLMPHWTKLDLFVFGRNRGPAIYFDLDVVITDWIDWVIPYCEASIAAPVDWSSGAFAGCLMAWHDDSASRAHECFTAAHAVKWYGDQDWLTACFSAVFERQVNRTCKPVVLKHGARKMPDGLCVSYKRHCRNGLPDGCSVVAFHGRPDPHEVRDKWVIDAWR